MANVTLEEVATTIAERIGYGATVVGFTGAGVSKASGIPTFRGAEGIWERRNVEDVASADALRRNPEQFWRFHDTLRPVLATAIPNSAHFVFAEMEERVSEDVEVAVVTQNIDRLHQRAGSRRVIELHGDALAYTCMKCGDKPDVPIPAPMYPPRCELCDGVIRPDVVLFREVLPPEALSEAQDLCSRADVLLVVGTSGLVEPAASLPYLALHAGALVVEINPTPTPLTGYVHYSIQATATAALPPLWERIEEKLNS